MCDQLSKPNNKFKLILLLLSLLFVLSVACRFIVGYNPPDNKEGDKGSFEIKATLTEQEAIGKVRAYVLEERNGMVNAPMVTYQERIRKRVS